MAQGGRGLAEATGGVTKKTGRVDMKKPPLAIPVRKGTAKPSIKLVAKASIKKAAAPLAKRRAAKPIPAQSSTPVAQGDPELEAYMRALDHPLKPALALVRRLILGVSPSIREGIKWNSPSFRTTDWFATINVHGKDGLRLILHMGAKPKASAKTGLKIADPSGQLKWLAKDRCLVTLGDEADVITRKRALQAIVRAWIDQVRKFEG